MSDPIEEIRQREQAATPGPWGWRGHISGSVSLLTLHSGGRAIIDTQRADPCIVTTGGPTVWDTELVLTWEACSACRKAFAAAEFDERITCEKPENTPTVWVQSERGGLVPVNRYAKAEVLQWSDHMYRDDVKDTTHPDAEFIAHAREDIRVLLAEVDRLRVALGEDVPVLPPVPVAPLRNARPVQSVELPAEDVADPLKLVCGHVPYGRDEALMVLPGRLLGQVEVKCPCCGIRAYRDADDDLDGDNCPYCDVQSVPA